jgi:hypothetical protein
MVSGSWGRPLTLTLPINRARPLFKAVSGKQMLSIFLPPVLSSLKLGQALWFNAQLV